MRGARSPAMWPWQASARVRIGVKAAQRGGSFGSRSGGNRQTMGKLRAAGRSRETDIGERVRR